MTSVVKKQSSLGSSSCVLIPQRSKIKISNRKIKERTSSPLFIRDLEGIIIS